MGLWWVPVWCLFLLGFEPCLPCLGSKVNGDTEFPHQALDSYTEALQVVPGKSQVRPVFPGWHMSSSDRMKFRNVRNAELSSSWLHGQHKPVVVVTRGDSWWLRLPTLQTWAWPSHLAPGNLDGKGTGHEWMFPGDMHRGRQFDSGWYILIPNRSR